MGRSKVRDQRLQPIRDRFRPLVSRSQEGLVVLQVLDANHRVLKSNSSRRKHADWTGSITGKMPAQMQAPVQPTRNRKRPQQEMQSAVARQLELIRRVQNLGCVRRS